MSHLKLEHERMPAGFWYAAYAIEVVRCEPDSIQTITKGLYEKIAREFHTTGDCVARNLRTLIMACWEHSDHELLDWITGVHLERMPTNKEFIDIMAAYLRK